MGLGKALNWVKDRGEDTWNSVTGNAANRDAGKAQTNAVAKAEAIQREALAKQEQLNEPWRQAGLTALSSLSNGNFEVPEQAFSERQPGDFVDNSGPEVPFQDRAFTFSPGSDPAAAYRQQQAALAIERSAAAGGGLFSGATLKDLAGESQALASQEFAASHGRYQADRNFRYGQYQDANQNRLINRNFQYGQHQDKLGQFNLNRSTHNTNQVNRRQAMNDRFTRLSTLAGLGTDATTRMGAGYANFGNSMADNIVGLGNAKAAQRIGQYNQNASFVMEGLNMGAKAAGGSK